MNGVYWSGENSNAKQTQKLLDRCVENGAAAWVGVEGECYGDWNTFDFDYWRYWGVDKMNATTCVYFLRPIVEEAIEFHPEMFIDPLFPTVEELLVYESFYGEFPSIIKNQEKQ